MSKKILMLSFFMLQLTIKLSMIKLTFEMKIPIRNKTKENNLYSREHNISEKKVPRKCIN